MDEAEPAVGVPHGADVRVGVGVLESHAECLEEKGGEKEGIGGPGAEGLRKDLEEGAEEEQLAEGEVGCQEGVCEGCEEPACEDGGVAVCK